MKRIAGILIAAVFAGIAASAQDTNFATRINCEIQTAQPESLADLTWIQGSTPMLELLPLRNGRAVRASTDTTVRVVFGESATATEYAVATNFWPSTNATSYFVQFGAVGTNTVDTNGTTAAWWYTVYFRDVSAGYDYWTGSGRLYIEESTSLADGLTWIDATNLPRVAWQNIDGTLTNNSDLVAYVSSAAGEDTIARAGVASNAASIAAVGAVASGAVQQTDATYTAAVEQAGTAYGWGNHAEAGYLPLSGYDGLVVLGTRTRGYEASTNLGEYGFAAGEGTSAGDHGFAAGESTSAGYAGFAAGANTSAGDYGFAAGESTSAGDYGFAAGAETSAGESGFAAGAGTSAGNAGFAAGMEAKGAAGSFIFADNSAGGMPFSRTNRPNEFAARAAGGVYFDTPLMAVTGTVSAGSITLGGETRTTWPSGGGSGATQLIINAAGQYAVTSTLSGAVLTVTDLPVPAGGGGGSESVSVEGDVLTYVFATNIALLASTNLWPQRILEVTNDFTLQVPTMADTNSAGIIWLTVPGISTHTATIPTSSPAIHGYVPALSTNAESELLFRWSPQATGWRVRRIR